MILIRGAFTETFQLAGQNALYRYKELEQYILQRRDELAPASNEISQEALLGEAPITSKSKADRKGFA